MKFTLALATEGNRLTVVLLLIEIRKKSRMTGFKTKTSWQETNVLHQRSIAAPFVALLIATTKTIISLSYRLDDLAARLSS